MYGSEHFAINMPSQRPSKAVGALRERVNVAVPERSQGTFPARASLWEHLIRYNFHRLKAMSNPLRGSKMVKYYVLLNLLARRTGLHLMPSEWDKLKTLVIYHLYKAKNQRRLQLLMYNALKRRRWHVRPMLRERKIFGAWYSLIPTLREHDPDEYFNFLRMTPESFDWLLELVSPALTKKSIRESISPGERLTVTLRYGYMCFTFYVYLFVCANHYVNYFFGYLASGDSHVSLSYLFRIGKQTISKIVTETTALIWFALKSKVFEPISPEFWRRKAAEFEVMWQFSMCVGAIDGKHCVFQKFPTRGSEYYNYTVSFEGGRRWYTTEVSQNDTSQLTVYKGTHSIVLLAMCDAKYRFIMVDIGARGRENDGGVFAKSDFGKARRVIENAFGILSARFRILRHTTVASETLAQNIILATVALHNLHLQREDSIPPKQRLYGPPGYADKFKSNGFIKKGRWRNDSEMLDKFYLKLGEQEVDRSNPTHDDELSPILIREKFLRLFIHEPVPWQWQIIPPIEEPQTPT
ncbi:LOW QUALITY PROTEIN: Protein ANTAGONIST OF LIKE HETEROCHROMATIN PROTEIN 1 [Frankliniella fusca]|uniref:Protein ANTAGONIST OF LIKE HETEROCHROMATIN PROTEIN 1 n=1 Tax=Frankliniella fusca TaxID=407009 RepID=A0AAE1HEL2_9NEOP|nr:LOW QUALITY PROTEIN: Protein ANTAGONIST OF LIKE HETEROCHROMATIN PROTEIN 1 [Frankliniella fusca]